MEFMIYEKKDTTALITGKELQANVARSASAALQGRVAGVTVSAANGGIFI